MSSGSRMSLSVDQQPLVFSQSTLPRMKESIIMSAANAPIASPGQVPKPLSQVDGPTLLGPTNTKTTCPFCCASIKTATRYTTTTRTHLTAAVLCCFILCCCCLPYCMNSARNTDHYCPNCQKYLGTYSK